MKIMIDDERCQKGSAATTCTANTINLLIIVPTYMGISGFDKNVVEVMTHTAIHCYRNMSRMGGETSIPL